MATMAKTSYTRQKVLDHFFGLASYPLHSNIFMALFSSDPNVTGPSAELSVGGYSRVEVHSTLVIHNDYLSNDSVIEFGPATEDWPPITHVGFIEDSSPALGTLMYVGAPQSARIIKNGNKCRFRIGELIVREY